MSGQPRCLISTRGPSRAPPCRSPSSWRGTHCWRWVGGAWLGGRLGGCSLGLTACLHGAVPMQLGQLWLLRPCHFQSATMTQQTAFAASLLLAWVQAKAAERQAALLQSSLSSRLRDCTFRPQTNHERRQEQLQRLLAQPSLGDSELAAAYY